MYWITRLDGIGMACGLTITISIVAGLCAAIGAAIAYDDEVTKNAIAWVKASIATAIATIFCAAFIPSTKEMCAILVVPAVANNEKVQGLGEDFYDLAKEWMQELKPTKGESK